MPKIESHREQTSHPMRLDRYLPIERHAVIGDRRTAALVGADGSIDWLCLPNFDGEIVFGRLLDADRGGRWRLGPQEECFLGTQRYLDDTAVAQTVWSTGKWQLELVDAMLWPDRTQTDRHSPQRIILRRLRCVRGKAPCSVQLDPRRMFTAPYPIRSDTQAAPPADTNWLGLWVSAHDIQEQLHGSSAAHFVLQQDQSIWMVLGDREDPHQWDVERAQAALDETISSWEQWASTHRFYGPRKEAVRRSVMTIRLLSFEPQGSQVASPTSSLPEKIGGSRNYDYRYAWIRDSSLALAILAVMGDLNAAEDYMDWLSRLSSSNEMPLQVIYRVDGGCEITETTFDTVEGYRGSTPVRLGNSAFAQLQLDSLGYLADCALIYLQQGGPWKPQYWEMIERIANFTASNWQREDSGIWELPQKRHYVSSKAMSWVVLERACRIADQLGSVQAPAHWRSAMQAIHDDVMRNGWSESLQAFRQHYDSDELDASALLLVTMEFLPATHPKMVSTVAAILEHLERDGLVWRFHPRSQGYADMPLDGLEGAFLPCSFWLCSALARMDQADEAESILDKIDALFGELGLFPEEVDPDTHTARGNMPLLFSHAEHLKAVMDYAKANPLTHMALIAGMMARKAKQVTGWT